MTVVKFLFVCSFNATASEPAASYLGEPTDSCKRFETTSAVGMTRLSSMFRSSIHIASVCRPNVSDCISEKLIDVVPLPVQRFDQSK